MRCLPFRSLVQRAVYGERQQVLGDRLVAAASHLRLIAPATVETMMLETEQLAGR